MDSSSESSDRGRRSKVVRLIDEYSDFLVVALLPEDANALDDDYRRVEEI